MRITIDELTDIIKSVNHCYLCKCKLDWSPGKGRTMPNSPTIDRLDNERFIDKNNIAIICHECNTIKGRRTLNEFLDYCELITNRHRSGKINRRNQGNSV